MYMCEIMDLAYQCKAGGGGRGEGGGEGRAWGGYLIVIVGLG